VVLVEEGDGEGAAVAERAGYPARERVVTEAEVREPLEPAEARRDRPGDAVVGEVQDLEVREVADGRG